MGLVWREHQTKPKDCLETYCCGPGEGYESLNYDVFRIKKEGIICIPDVSSLGHWGNGTAIVRIQKAGIRKELDKGVGGKLATQYIDLVDILPELKYGVKMTVKTEIWGLGKGWGW